MSYPEAAKRYYELSPTSVPLLREDSRHSPDVVSSPPDKREQARERQRRKRERDRASAAMTLAPGGTPDMNLAPRGLGIRDSLSVIKRGGGGKGASLDDLPLEEAQRKQRIREAARERQRKHRAGVKARRMAELGMAIGTSVNEGGRVEQTAIGYTINEQGQYEAVLADPSDPNLQHPQAPPPFPVPQPHATPGQMFASTLLYGLSYTPQIKQQLLRALRSTNEDIAAFEPFMAAAFDHWDSGRAMHYAAQGHHIPPHMPTQSAPFAQPYPPGNERFQRQPLLAAFPTGPPHGRHISPSPSEESHQADDDSDTQIEDEFHRSRHEASSGRIRESGEIATMRTDSSWSKRQRDVSSEEGRQPSREH